MDALHPQRDVQEHEQRSPALADEQKQVSPPPQAVQSAEQHHEKVKLREINSYLTCHLCKGYLIDAATISECLHSFCRSCIIKFLEDNSFCPVCEVIINKAKPNLKPDKTLQDIIYKLVPGLFLAEMLRRKRFYAERPGEAARVSPEQRGEDTERTIFNPQDRISLSLEYIGDAATSGRILKDLRTTLEKQQGVANSDADSKKNESEDIQAESLLKRYLQCPGMCRIDVIKKFIRNKYNVNTDIFQIDILYKRVPLPLPDHYTLIDIAYIYTWKRNEPMRFYFRITEKGNNELPDLTKVFTPIDGPPLIRPQARSTPMKKLAKCSTSESKERKKRTPKKKVSVSRLVKKEDYSNCDKITDNIECKSEVFADKTSIEPSEKTLDKTCDKTISDIPGDHPDTTADCAKRELDVPKTELNDKEELKKEVYTNITLNRTNNVEIITKIHKVSDKDGQPIGMNIINQTVKKTSNSNNNSTTQKSTPPPVLEEVEMKIEHIKKEIASPETEMPILKQEALTVVKEEPCLDVKQEPETVPSTNKISLTESELEQKKFEFLKSIELTSKKVVDNLARLMKKQQARNTSSTPQSSQSKINVPTTKPCYSLKPPIPNATMEILKTKKNVTIKPGTNGVKRKNSSPVKNDPKKPKLEPKRTTKIILQQKPGYPPVNPMKLNDSTKVSDNKSDLHSLFQNCRLNIPSSLSITLKEDGGMSRKPVQIPPVQNYIEILKIDEKEGKRTITLKREDLSPMNPTPDTKKTTGVDHKSTENCINPNQAKIVQPLQRPSSVDSGELSNKPKENKNNAQLHSFQKIFEESIMKSEVESSQSNAAADLMNGAGKRNLMEIAQQLYKKNKIEHESRKSQVSQDKNETSPMIANVPKIPIPRLNNQRVLKPPKKNQKYENPTHQTLANLHSNNSPKKNQKYEHLPHQTLSNLHSSSLGLNYTVSVGKQSKDPVQQTYTINGVMSSSDLNSKSPIRDKVNNEQIAIKQSPFKSSPVSPKTVDSKQSLERFSPKNCKVPHSPRPSIASPAPRTEHSPLPSPKNPTCRNYTAKTPQSSPKPRTSSASPKLAQSAGSNLVSSSSSSSLNSNQLLEKYNIQNLAQLSASMNFNANTIPPNYLNAAVQGNQMAVFHQAMLMTQLEMQNRQKWLTINQGPLLQFEKYLQSLSAPKNQILGNIKDN